MAIIKKTVYINAPVEKVFNFLIKSENLPEIWPSMVNVSNIKGSPSDQLSFDWEYKMAGIHFNGHSQSKDVIINKHVVMENDKGIPSTFTWDYHDEGGKTKLDLQVDYTFPKSVVNKLAENVVAKLNEHEAETLLDNLKTCMEN